MSVPERARWDDAVRAGLPGRELRIVNRDPRYSKVALAEPTALGYVYVAGRVRAGRGPLVLPSRERSELLHRLKPLARGVERLDEVVRATVFRAIVRPPTARLSGYLKTHAGSIRVADFDVAVLIETTSPATARDLLARAAGQAVVQAVQARCESVYVLAARNARRIADVDTSRPGLFLFNHFAADDADVMLELWDYLADWYVKETGLDNSIALVPAAGEHREYAIVNWARWDVGPVRHFWHQLSRRSFWRYVTANLEANQAASMPVYCRLA